MEIHTLWEKMGELSGKRWTGGGVDLSLFKSRKGYGYNVRKAQRMPSNVASEIPWAIMGSTQRPS